jgi:CheY-like chemotaxis protein
MTGDRERFLARGMTGYVSKPIRPRELDEAIERALTGVRGPETGRAAAATNPATAALA